MIKQDNIFMHKQPYVLGVAFFLSPLFLSKKLTDMSFQTKILFSGVILLILVLVQKAIQKQFIQDSDETELKNAVKV